MITMTNTQKSKVGKAVFSKSNPMKNLIILFLMVCTAYGVNAQQDETIFKHYYLNHSLVNPAASGIEDTHEIRLNVRNQFAGFPGAPQTYSVGYNGPIGKTFGLGVNVLTENIASLTRYRLQLAYAFRYSTENLKMNIGFSTEFHEMRIPQGDNNNPLFDAGDILLADAEDGLMLFDATLGVYGKFKEKTFFSLSVPNLIRARLDNVSPNNDDPSGFLQYFMLMGGHRFDLNNSSISIEPSMMITKVRDVPVIVDANLKVSFLDEKLAAGVTFRTGPATSLGFMLGTKINVLKLYYSYDSHMGQFASYNQGSHEVTLGFSFGSKKAAPVKQLEKDSTKRYKR